MATITYGRTLPDFDNFSQFDGKTLAISWLSENTFTMKDKDGTSMVFEGEGFESARKIITDGVIESAKFFNAEGQRLYTFDGLSADAAGLFEAFSLNNDPLRILHGLMDSDDTVTGSKRKDSIWGFAGVDTLMGMGGEDWLYGHRGNDTMTGGAGADTFAFLTGYDSDTITDFDLTGKDHDVIHMDYYLHDDLAFTEDGLNLILELPTGDRLTLLNVTQAQIEGKDRYFDFF